MSNKWHTCGMMKMCCHLRSVVFEILRRHNLRRHHWMRQRYSSFYNSKKERVVAQYCINNIWYMWGVERNNLQLIGAQKDLTYLVKQTYVISTLRLSYSVPRHWQQELRSVGAVQLWKDVVRHILCTCWNGSCWIVNRLDRTYELKWTHMRDSSTGTKPVTLFNCN